jgi:hypothetical protein
MDKSFIVFLAVGVAFFYLITSFVGDIEKDDAGYTNSIVTDQERYAQYLTVDSIGQSILDVTLADPKTQVQAWNASPLREEMLDIFPDFDTMKGFVKNRVRGEELVQKLLKRITQVEDKFFSGTMSAEQAKRSLEHL